jgi:AraC-like DNA-binding protein
VIVLGVGGPVLTILADLSGVVGSVVAVLDAVVLSRGPEVVVAGFTCTDHRPAWSEPEVQDDVRLVLVHRGRFRRRVGGVASTVDTTAGYLGLPGEEEQFAHPAGGDRCTCLRIAAPFWRRLAGPDARPVTPALYVDARLELAHRRVVAAAGGGDPAFAVVEELLELVATVLVRTVAVRTPADVTGDPARAALVARAREAIAAGDPAADGLVPLADALGVSPYRLSRAFPAELGISLTHYRNRVRVGRALGRLEDGAPSLAALAAELGFADQAHLTRTVRRHTGCTPAAVRRLLGR